MSAKDTSNEYDPGALRRVVDAADEVRTFLPKKKIDLVLEVLENDGFKVPSSYALEGIVSPSHADRFVRIAKRVGHEGIFALSVALSVKEGEKLSDKVRICVTEPTAGMPASPTWPALEAMISSAKDEIIIVDYEMNHAMDVVMDKLMEKVRGGVKLTLVLDKLDWKPELIGWIQSLPFRPDVFYRPVDKDDWLSAMHIKCIIVDMREAMFGSANLTRHGMQKNIEMNLLIHDEVLVREISMVVDALKGQLTRYELAESCIPR